MAPLEVAAEAPATKRRKMRDGEARRERSERGDGAERPQMDRLSIRGPKQAREESAPPRRAQRRQSTDSPSAQLAGAVRRDSDEEEEEGGEAPRRRDSSSSPSPSQSPQRPRRRQRSPTDDDNDNDDDDESVSELSSRAHTPRSASPPLRGSPRSPRSRSHSRSRSRSRSQSRPPRARSTSSNFRSRRQTTRTTQTKPKQKSGRQKRRSDPPPRPHYRRVLAMRGHDGPIAQVRISPDGRWIASASADGTARIWDAATGAHMTTLVGHVAGLSCLAWSPDSNTLATGSDDKAIRLWDRVTAEPAHAVGSQQAAEEDEDEDGNCEDNDEGGGSGSARANRVAVPTAAALAVRFARRQLREGINGTNGNGRASSGGARGTRLPLLGHHNYVYCLAFSPKGNILASGSYDEAVFLWDVRAGRLMRSLPAHSDPVSGIDFCCDGTLVVSCSTDGLIRIWDTGTGQCLRTLLLLNEDNPAVTNVCFSPNGRFVLAFNLDSCIRLWDYVAQPSIVKKTYQGHLNKRFSIGGCFGMLADDGGGGGGRSGPGQSYRPFVAAASEDGDVVLWDVGSKTIVQRLRGAHRDGVCFWVDVCGATMVSCGQDGWINVYRHTGPGEAVPDPRRADKAAHEREGTSE
ncbi:WD domain protein [Sporothrix curviconia]|uniref:Mitochondrial division protein 1 n=1 Tax=Sporothrix curviconia TaxID=1260050 RepID=A0ABP0B827_9PEZI